ncbi:hypothetical protein ACFL6Y_09205 [Elusimicrobiota bacterium]
MVELNIKCMFCGHSLRDEQVRLDSCPSVRVNIVSGRRKGDLYLSSLYESRTTFVSIDLPEWKIARFYCPHCGKELRDSRKCSKCAAPLVPLEREEGGLILVCSRKGCKKPLYQFEDIDVAMSAFYEAYPLFFK